MKLEDVEVGMKVVPHAKNWGDNTGYYFSKGKLTEGRKYLYVTEIELDCSDLSIEYVVLGDYRDIKIKNGDFFLPSDFEPYIESQEVTSIIVDDITLSTDGKFVKLQKDDLVGLARCNIKEDKFDLTVGLKLAAERLNETIARRKEDLLHTFKINDIVTVYECQGLYYLMQGVVVGYTTDDKYKVKLVNGKTKIFKEDHLSKF